MLIRIEFTGQFWNSIRACLHEGGGPQATGKVSRLGRVTRLSI